MDVIGGIVGLANLLLSAVVGARLVKLARTTPGGPELAETILPRPGKMRIDILSPIDQSNPAYGNSKDLATLTRNRILSVLDEPDLLGTKSVDQTTP